MYPSFGNLAPRDISSRAAKRVCDEGRGVGPTGLGVYLDFQDAIQRLGKNKIEEKYGNLFEMYERITDENPYEVPMRIYPATHYTMGGLWVDYNLMSTIPGLFVLGRGELLRPRRQPPRRLGPDAGPGRRLLRHPVHDRQLPRRREVHAGARPTTPRSGRPRRPWPSATKRLLSIKGKRTATSFHRELGKIMWEHCGMARDRKGLEQGLAMIPKLREEFWKNVTVPGGGRGAQPVAGASPAAWPTSSSSASSCASTRSSATSPAAATSATEHQTPDGEAQRDDENFCHVAAWEYHGRREEARSGTSSRWSTRTWSWP